MDLVYICKDGNNEELRYSIRSAVENLPHENIWVVGGKPGWYTGNHIPVRQGNKPYDNVKASLKAIIDHTEVSHDFILMNDDFFIMNPISDLPYFYTGTMDEKINDYMIRNKSYGYIKLLIKTRSELNRLGHKDVLDYELHVPFKMNKERLLPILEMRSLSRSLYGNIYDVGGTRMDDVKYAHNDVKPSDICDFLSSDDKSFDYLFHLVLRDRFPVPSIYESPQLDSNQRP